MKGKGAKGLGLYVLSCRGELFLNFHRVYLDYHLTT
jgi:hypothetical protein